MVGCMGKPLTDTAAALRPGSARLGTTGGSAGCSPHRHIRRARSRGGQPQWRRKFLNGLAAGGMKEALLQSGKDLGDAVLAALDDPAFRERLELIRLERLAAAEQQLVDLLLLKLDEPEVSLEKSVLSLWQSLREDRRKQAAPADVVKAPARKARHAIPAERQEAGRRAAKRAEEFNQLLEVIRARLAAAEAKKASGT